MNAKGGIRLRGFKAGGKINKEQRAEACAVQTRPKIPYGLVPVRSERWLYRSLREAVPIIDAAVNKTRRLIGGFTIKCGDANTEKELNEFLAEVKVGPMNRGINEFIGTYLEELITYGSAVGEIVLRGGRIAALYNASLEDIELKEKTPLEITACVNDHGEVKECRYPELIMFSALNPEPGQIYGVSVLRGLPFISEILLKIYRTIGVNWERVGNVRFAVSCRQDGPGLSQERAKQVASEWQKAMHSPEISDFISIGEVSIKAVGSDIQILDSQVPVRQMLEQIVAKMGIPPFLLGLSWSSTERMSSQQADILTSELEAYRRILNPVITKIVDLWLRMNGRFTEYSVEWDDITMQDEVDHTNALNTIAKTRLIEQQIKEKE